MANKDLVYRFFGVDAGAGRELDRMAGKVDTGGMAWKKYALGAGVAVAAVAAYSLKMAVDFQKSTEMIHTQAGRSQADVDMMRKGILAMAGAVGTSPAELSVALFHIASTGLNAAKSLQVLRVAAEGAKIGNANLEDVTNALNATIVSGIKGAGNFAHAMGALNAIVGAGDMHMQDLAEALGSGVLAVVKTFGVTLPQAGAALATFGDNNIRGAQAATYLRQAVQSLSAPSAKADAALSQVHLTAAQLQAALAKGGLSGALDMLHTHFAASGIAVNKWGDIMEAAFTKKAGTGISVLLSQFGRYETKLAEVRDGSKNFGNDWAATTKNLSFQFDRLRADVEVLAIKFGDALIPVAMDVIHILFGIGHAVEGVVGWFDKHKAATAALAAVIGSALIPRLLVMAQAFAVNTLVGFANGLALVINRLFGTTKAMGEVNDTAGLMTGALNPITLALTAVAAVGLYTWEKSRQAVAHAKQGVDDYVSSLHAVPSSIASLNSAISTMSSRQTELSVVISKSGGSLTAFRAAAGEYQSQLQGLQAQQKQVASNEGHMQQEYGLSRQQVEALAKSAGIDLSGSLLSVDQGFTAAIDAAKQSHSPAKQASADFQDMSSKASTLDTALNDLSDAWNRYLGNFIGLKQQQLDFRNNLAQLRGELKKSGNSIGNNSAAARTARGDFLQLVGTIGDLTAGTYKSSGAQQKAVAAAEGYRSSIKALGLSGPLAVKTLSKLTAFIQNFKNEAGGDGKTTADNYAAGLVLGLQKAKGSVHTAAFDLGGQMVQGTSDRIISRSPAKAAIKLGHWYALGLAIGMNSKGKEVYASGATAAHLLALGLTRGFSGESVKVRDSFSQSLQSILSRVSSQIAAALTKQRGLLKTYRQQLASDLNAQQSAIASLRDSIAGNADLSNILHRSRTITSSTMDFTGSSAVAGSASRTVNYTANLGGYLKGQAGLLKREAGMFARLRKMGLSPALLAQISGLAPSDAITVMSQILSGQDGSIASLNAYEGRIRSYAKQVAAGTVNTRHELNLLKGDRQQIHDQTALLHKIEEHLRHFRNHPQQSVQLHMALHEAGFTDAEIKKIIARIRKVNRESGGRVTVL